MIPFEEIDKRLEALGKDRAWLAKMAKRSAGAIRSALAPNAAAKHRSELLQDALSKVIEREEQAQSGLKTPRIHGVFDVYQTAEQARKTDRASREINAASIEDFCLQAILFRADEILRTGKDPLAAQAQPVAPPNVVDLTPHTALPFFGMVAAGQPASQFDPDSGTEEVPGEYDPANHFVLRINGRSMEPDYPDRSLIVCRRLRNGEYPTKGTDVIACDSAGSYIKRLAYVKDGPKGDTPRKARPRLVSINPEFPEVVPQSDCPVQAVVVAKL